MFLYNSVLRVWRDAGGIYDRRRHALAMLRSAAVLSSLNCILRRNYLAKDRRAQNALLGSYIPPAPFLTRRTLFCKFYIFVVYIPQRICYDT